MNPPPEAVVREIHEGCRTAEVTLGEVVDVTGWLGGYNFQWAWTSGHAAGEVAWMAAAAELF